MAALLLGLWMLTDQTIRTTLEASAEEAVDVDLAGLVDIYASGGQEELASRIADRLALVPADGSTPHYMLSDAGGSRIAGDIAEWPQLDPAVSESGEIAIGKGTRAFARATMLGPDLQLVVAHEASDGAALRQRVGLVFAGGGALFVALLAIFGRTAASRLHRRIERINTAFRAPQGEELAGLQSLPGEDEIDELASHSAAAIERQARLIEAYRDTSDQVAHEIRTPLMHLDGRLVKALAAKPEADVAERLLEARAEIRRLVGTLESLLDIAASKAQQGDTSGLRDLDLSELATRVCELYADSAEESGHGFSWHVTPGITMLGDEAQISRIITNLLDNAFKYVPAGGSVELRLQPGPVLDVVDDGPGVPAHDRERIFERFFRSDSGQNDRPGSGLGLALAAAIARRHDMTLSLVDSPVGAHFRLSGGSR